MRKVKTLVGPSRTTDRGTLRKPGPIYETFMCPFHPSHAHSFCRFFAYFPISSVPDVVSNDALFSHWIDETVVFEMELTALGYPETQPRCIDAFAEDDSVLNAWLNLESRFNAEKVEAQLSSADAWNGRYQTASDIDEFKVPECVDDFLILL